MVRSQPRQIQSGTRERMLWALALAEVEEHYGKLKPISDECAVSIAHHFAGVNVATTPFLQLSRGLEIYLRQLLSAIRQARNGKTDQEQCALDSLFHWAMCKAQ